MFYPREVHHKTLSLATVILAIIPITAPERPSIHTYTYHKEPLPWDEASANCDARGGAISPVFSPEMEQKVLSVAGNSPTLWLGAQLTQSPHWAWLHGDRKVNNTDFEPGNPSSCAYFSVVVHSVGYVEINNKEDCTTSLPYICSKRACNPSIENNCFTVHKEVNASGWEDAEARCDRQGERLVSLPVEFEALENSVQRFDMMTAFLGLPLERGRYWVGLRRRGWQFSVGGDVIFSRGNIWDTSLNSSRRCIVMNATWWEPQDCQQQYPYVCVSYDYNSGLGVAVWVIAVSVVAGVVVLAVVIGTAVYCYRKTKG